MKHFFSRAGAAALAALLLTTLVMPVAAQTTTLDNQPLFSGEGVPGNLALVLSVEYPTAISVANLGDYLDSSGSDSLTFLGYFDPLKCYTYNYNSTTPKSSYFVPDSLAIGTNYHQCAAGKNLWSGNFMNWATMQTIDPFRWALTGGYRSIDTPTQTILEKAWASQQGCPPDTTFTVYQRLYNCSNPNFPYRGTDRPTGNYLLTAWVSKVVPFSTWTDHFNTAVGWNNNVMLFGRGSVSAANGVGSGTANSSVYDMPSNANISATTSATDSGVTPNTASNSAVYRVYIRVSVCNSGLLESNCVKYGSNYKPEGLLQQYSKQIRYSAFSYVNGTGAAPQRQGGVLREPMNFIGPTYSQPLTSTVTTNTADPEWSATDGTQSLKPDTATANGSGAPQSGVINYLNSFGEYGASTGNWTNTYMTSDNLSELYYAAIRYYENLGNVPEWSTVPTATAYELDGFPAVTTWVDPIIYACQKNFILGIGDDHTQADFNVGGGTVSDSAASRTKPSLVANDTFNQAATWTTNLQNLEGITPTPWWTYYQENSALTHGPDATYYIAGLAYGAHVNDIRPDKASQPTTIGTQTISTYWLDVEEYGYPEYQNPYYLATKYGGFTVPTNYTTANTTPLTQGWWDTSGNAISMHTVNNGYTSVQQPDNYFLAGNANLMVTGLQSAFANIASAIQIYTSSFAFSAANVTTSTESFASAYNSNVWSATIAASTLTFDSSGNPTTVPLWTTDTTLLAQLAGNGWQSTGRRVATWSGSGGITFEASTITAAQTTAITFSASTYSPSTTPTQYLSYLRGDQTNEVGSTITPSTKSLRARNLLLGDIVDSKLTPVTTPSQVFSDANNPGYAAFKALYTNRATLVYAGANDGMLHGFLGSNGTEQFAYVPSALFQGPNNTPQVDGLAQLGNPNYLHHYYVDATPLAFDIDLGHTGGTTAAVSWSTVLIGGLGKGGTSFYAIDITDPANKTTTEAQAAANVKWEFTQPAMGYSFGAPVVVKTAKWGWVVALTSGYYTTGSTNSDTFGHLYLVNPKTGALIQDIPTPSPSNGLTQAAAYVRDYSDYTADSIYVGDLSGQIWRFDLTTASGSYPAPTLIATLADGSGNIQPVTTAPLVEISPTTRLRYVMVGTGKLLAATDVTVKTTQSFYAILDGTAGGFNAPPSMPITRSVLTPVPDVTDGIKLPSTSNGWYIDLGVDATSTIAWRVVVNPIAYNGIASFATLLTSSDPCNPGGTSQVYALNYSTATSVIQPTSASSTTPAPYYSIAAAVTSEKIFDNKGNPELIVGCGGSMTCITPIPANLTGVIATRLLNWREIPTAE